MKPKPQAATIADYIAAAPAAGRPQLQRLHALLKAAAPQAQEAIKWGTPFFIEPRFVFAFSAHKAHLGFAPGEACIAHFAAELQWHDTTKNLLKVGYEDALPEALIGRMAAWCVAAVAARDSESFW